MFDYIIIGSGLAGAVAAEQLSNLGKSVLIIEKRRHIGGNVFDEYNTEGVLIHRYGPHIFHTDQQKVWDYVNQFTEWTPYQHNVLASIEGKLAPIPFNLNTIEQLFPAQLALSLTEKLLSSFEYGTKIPIIKLIENPDKDLQFLANYVNQHVFLHYTLKQWGTDPKSLDPSIFNRVPILISKDNRYFQDPYQAMPKYGYTPLFENLLSSPKIKVLLNTDRKELIRLNPETKTITFLDQPFSGKLIYTGLLDDLFDYQLGELPYRSLRFENITYHKEAYQSAAVINYPNNYGFTRITEYKKLTGQEIPKTTVATEYPEPYIKNTNIPYYPIFSDENQKKYQNYQSLTHQFSSLITVGRLAEYKYYDMDDIILKVLTLIDELKYQ